jgi:hypothetical protein
VSSLPPIEGTLSAKPFDNAISGRVSGSTESSRSGSVHGRADGSRTGSVSGDSGDTPESAAVAELGGLISSLGSLSAQAQGLPLSAPTLPGLPQGGYQAQPTDYTQFSDDAS